MYIEWIQCIVYSNPIYNLYLKILNPSYLPELKEVF